MEDGNEQTQSYCILSVNTWHYIKTSGYIKKKKNIYVNINSLIYTIYVNKHTSSKNVDNSSHNPMLVHIECKHIMADRNEQTCRVTVFNNYIKKRKKNALTTPWHHYSAWVK